MTTDLQVSWAGATSSEPGQTNIWGARRLGRWRKACPERSRMGVSLSRTCTD